MKKLIALILVIASLNIYADDNNLGQDKDGFTCELQQDGTSSTPTAACINYNTLTSQIINGDKTELAWVKLVIFSQKGVKKEIIQQVVYDCSANKSGPLVQIKINSNAEIVSTWKASKSTFVLSPINPGTVDDYFKNLACNYNQSGS